MGIIDLTCAKIPIKLAKINGVALTTVAGAMLVLGLGRGINNVAARNSFEHFYFKYLQHNLL